MRIVTITRLAAFLLAFLALSLAIILYWGLGKLNQSFVSTLNYSELHRQLAVDVRGKIGNYLETGDATQHSAAVSDLEHLQQQVMPSLPATLVAQLEPVAATLHLGLTHELLGAGKLAGDAQGLLYQNERETTTELRRLENYALQVLKEQPTAGVSYLQGIVRLTDFLSDIKTYREQFWTSGKDSYLQQLNLTLLSYEAALENLKTLPRIGIYPEKKQDSMASLMGWETQSLAVNEEEQGDEILRNLTSLHKRYPAEIKRSVKWQQDRIDSFLLVNTLVDDFEQAIIQGQAEINLSKENVESWVKTLFFAFVLGLLFMAVLLYVFQQRFVIKNLSKLELALTVLVKQGSLNFVDMEADKTELGQIAKRFNQLISGMKKQQEQKDLQLQEVGITLEQLLESFDSIASNTLNTRKQLKKAGKSSENLNYLAEQVSASSTKVKSFAEETANLMDSSEQSAVEVVRAGEEAIQKIDLGQLALVDLIHAVQEVMGILDQVNHISDQTNLLALNATIEAANAGEYGRAFAVVADEVRQLSRQTQGAVGKSTDLLGALNNVTDRLKEHIEAVALSTHFQCDLARKLQETSQEVRQRSFHAAETAQESSDLTKRQYDSVGEFNVQIHEMEQGANDAGKKIKQLHANVSDKIDWLRTNLGLSH